MTTEELLKPRWKVIADFPFNTYYKVGGVITDDRLMAARNETGHAVFACEWNDYPNIFRKLKWWEERNIEDMPEYVKMLSYIKPCTNNTENLELKKGEIVKPDKWGLNSFEISHWVFSASLTIPSTEEEFNSNK